MLGRVHKRCLMRILPVGLLRMLVVFLRVWMLERSVPLLLLLLLLLPMKMHYGLLSLTRGVVLGKNVKVQNNVSLYEGLTVEDDVFLGPSCVFTNVRNPRSAVNRRGAYESTLVKRGATIGANATIRCGVTLGAHSFVAAGAVVTEDVPDHALVMGVPAKHAGWMSAHGVQLAFDAQGRATCPESGQSYQLNNHEITPL